jgi:hypothetical protein
MKRMYKLVIVSALVILTACATVAGGAIGAGIGSVSGNTAAGAAIGAGAGMLVDIF